MFYRRDENFLRIITNLEGYKDAKEVKDYNKVNEPRKKLSLDENLYERNWPLVDINVGPSMFDLIRFKTQ